MLFNLIPFGLYICFLLIALIVGSRSLTHPWLFLLRSLFPSWQFLHRLGRVPRLYYRYKKSTGDSLSEDTDPQWSAWILYLPKMKPSLRHLFFNANGNLKLLEQTLIEQLLQECAEIHENNEASKLVSYRMVERLVQKILTAQNDKTIDYQFKIMAPELGQAHIDDDDLVLHSPIMRLNHE